MNKTIITLLAVCFHVSVYGQIPLKSEGFTRTQHGYLIYINAFKDDLTFVPMIADSISNNLSNFDSKNLGVGFQMNNRHIIIDSLKKFGKEYKLENFWNDNTLITIIPITLTYSIPRYGRTKIQMEEATQDFKFKILNKFITVWNIGGMSLKIISSNPKIYYYDSWE